MSNNEKIERLRSHLRETYKSQWDEIKFADTKATALFAINIGIAVAFLETLNSVKTPFDLSCKSTLLSGCYFTSVTAFWTLSTIIPRTKVNHDSPEEEGFFEWLQFLFNPGAKPAPKQNTCDFVTVLTLFFLPIAILYSLTSFTIIIILFIFFNPYFFFCRNFNHPHARPKEFWIAGYTDSNDYKTFLKKTFGIDNGLDNELDIAFIQEMRRISVVASRKYACTSRAYRSCALAFASLIIFIMFHGFHTNELNTKNEITSSLITVSIPASQHETNRLTIEVRKNPD